MAIAHLKIMIYFVTTFCPQPQVSVSVKAAPVCVEDDEDEDGWVDCSDEEFYEEEEGL